MAATLRANTLMLGILTTILLGWVMHVGAGILQPLVIAFLLCSMLQPVVRGLARFYIPPPVTVILLVTGILLAVSRIGVLVNQNVVYFLGQQAEVGRRAEHEPPPLIRRPNDRADEGEFQLTAPPGALGAGGFVTGVGEAYEIGSEPDSKGPEPNSGTDADSGWASEPGAEDARVAGADKLDSGAVYGPLLPTQEERDAAKKQGMVARAMGDDVDPFSPEQAELVKTAGGWTGIVQGLSVQLKGRDLPGPLVKYIVESLRKIDLPGLANDVIGGGFEFGKSLLLVIIYMLFIFAEQAVFRRKILSVAGDRQQDAEAVLDTIGRGIQRYLGVKTIVSITTGALCYAVLVFLDIPFALLFGFVTFLLNYIPTFGSIIAGIFPTLTAVADDGGSLNKAFWVVITYATVNTVLGSYLEPKILGRELNLSPLVIIISVVVWAALWGVVGAFLAVPLTAGIQIVLASQERTHPIAVMLSSGPPKDDRKRRGRLEATGFGNVS